MDLKNVWAKLFEGYFHKNEPKKQYKSIVTLKNITKLKKLTRIGKTKKE